MFGHKIYDGFMKPLENLRLATKRSALMEDVSGDLLEIGYGTGANLKYYLYEQIDSLTLLDTSIPPHLNTSAIPVNKEFNIYQGDVQTLPFEDNSFDSIVFTLIFCSVEDPMKGLSEIRRILKPEGRIYFIEHVLPTKQPYKDVFNKLTPAWSKIAHQCHLNRDTVGAIQQSGFHLVEYHRFFRTSFATGVAIKD